MAVTKPGTRNRSSVHRPDDDDYPTPADAVWPLLSAETISGPVWEPACGAGALCQVLDQAGLPFIATTLVDRGYGESGRDFLSERELLAPAIITNPPYSHALEFILHSLALGAELAAFLLRLKFLESRDRYRRLFEKHPPARVHVFVNRVHFFAGDTPKSEQPGWSNEAFAWFVWDAFAQGTETVLRWMHTRDGRQGELLR